MSRKSTFYNNKPVQYQYIYLYKDHQGRVLGGANNTINYFTQLAKEKDFSNYKDFKSNE